MIGTRPAYADGMHLTVNVPRILLLICVVAYASPLQAQTYESIKKEANALEKKIKRSDGSDYDELKGAVAELRRQATDNKVNYIGSTIDALERDVKRLDQKRVAVVAQKEMDQLTAAMRETDGTDADELTAKVEAFRTKYAEILGLLHRRDMQKALGGLAKKKAQASILSDTVVKRLGMTSEDAYDLEKVAEAFEKTPAEKRFYVEESVGAYQPTPDHKSEQTQSYKVDPKTKWRKPLWQKAVMVIAVPKATIPKNTPLLLWEEHVLVTPSGGRYLLEYYAEKFVKTVKRGMPTGKWEKEAGVYLVPKDIAFLEAKGQLRNGLSKKIEKARRKGDDCSDRIWRRVEPRFEKIRNANITSRVRANRTEALRIKTAKKVASKCRRHLEAFGRAFAPAVAARSKQRAACAKSVDAALK